VRSILARAMKVLAQGNGDLAQGLLREVLSVEPGNIPAGLLLAKLEAESGDGTAAVETLGRLWERTHDRNVGDALAEVSRAVVSGFAQRRQEDRAVVERLAGLLRALHGPDSILVDTLQYDIIGGLAIDAILLIPIIKAGLAERSGKSVAFFSGHSANPALVEMLSRELPVFRDERFPKLMPYCDYDWEKGRYSLKPEFTRDFFGHHGDLFVDLVEFTHSTNGRAYCRTPDEGSMGLSLASPQISFSPEDREQGDMFLQDVLGMGENDWFVCVYARDGAYYGESPESGNWFRNSDIGTFLRSIDAILARGGFVVRIGERTSHVCEHDDPRFLDYSNSPHRSPLLDLYLIAKCRFLLGTPSGLCHVAYALRTPTLLVNSINVCSVSSADLYIPKLIRDSRSGQRLRFAEFIERLYGHGDIGLFLENGNNQRKLLHATYEDNSPEDILAATGEMLARLEGRHRDTQEAAALRERFRMAWRPWAAHLGDTVIAASFLEAHAQLFA